MRKTELTAAYRNIEVSDRGAGVRAVAADSLEFRPAGEQADGADFDVFNSDGSSFIGYLSVSAGPDGWWRLLEQGRHGIRVVSHPVAEPSDDLAAAVQSAIRSAALAHRRNRKAPAECWAPAEYRIGARARA